MMTKNLFVGIELMRRIGNEVNEVEKWWIIKMTWFKSRFNQYNIRKKLGKLFLPGKRFEIPVVHFDNQHF